MLSVIISGSPYYGKEGTDVTLPTFTNFGGSLLTNFLNTIRMESSRMQDLLDTPADVERWCGFMLQTGWLSAQQYHRLELGPMLLSPLRLFRSTSRRFLAQHSDPNSLGSWLTEQLASRSLTFQVHNAERTGWTCMPIPEQGGTDGLIALLAYDWMRLGGSKSLERVKRCESPHCLAYFVNESGRRKWCSMEGCGNRQKSRRHYRRGHRAREGENESSV